MSQLEPRRLVTNAAEVVTCAGFSATPARGADHERIGVIDRGAVLVQGDRIVEVGLAKDLSHYEREPDVQVLDAKGGVVLPGLVDCHTHLVFAGDRASEWESNMAGKPYLDILRDGGGILSTVRATRAASEEELFTSAQRWAGRMLAQGTTMIEAKSGYSLDREGELRQLRVAQRLSQSFPGEIVNTYLGAHVVPPEYRHDRARYVDLVCELCAEVAAQKLASFVDVFCEKEAFTLEETERIARAAQAQGLGVKIHAEQLSASGAAALGAALGATSVDHLEHVDQDSIRRLARASVIGVLLPAVSFHLDLDRYPPARQMLAANMALALATDLNPGSAFTPGLPLVMALACRKLRLSPAAAITACTINAAHALGRAQEVGSIERGKRADLIICDIPSHLWLGYAFGFNPVRQVMARGRLAHG